MTNVHVSEKIIFRILLLAKMENIWASFIDDSAITCDEIIDAEAEAKSNNEATSNDKAKSSIEETKICPTNFNGKNIAYEGQVFFILLTVLLITIAILIAVSIYCYVIKYQAKQKHILQFTSHITN